MLVAKWFRHRAKPWTWQKQYWLLLAPAVVKGNVKRAEELRKFQCNRKGDVCCPQRTFPQHGQTITDTALGHRAASLSSYPWTWSPIRRERLRAFSSPSWIVPDLAKIFTSHFVLLASWPVEILGQFHSLLILLQRTFEIKYYHTQECYSIRFGKLNRYIEHHK